MSQPSLRKQNQDPNEQHYQPKKNGEYYQANYLSRTCIGKLYQESNDNEDK